MCGAEFCGWELCGAGAEWESCGRWPKAPEKGRHSATNPAAIKIASRVPFKARVCITPFIVSVGPRRFDSTIANTPSRRCWDYQ